MTCPVCLQAPAKLLRALNKCSQQQVLKMIKLRHTSTLRRVNQQSFRLPAGTWASHAMLVVHPKSNALWEAFPTPCLGAATTGGSLGGQVCVFLSFPTPQTGTCSAAASVP